VFAPTNDAFEAISSTLATLSGAEVRDVLLLHVVSGTAVMSSALVEDGSIEAISGTLTSVRRQGSWMIESGKTTAKVIQADVKASNGIAHVIDTVLLPPDASTAAASTTNPDKREADATSTSASSEGTQVGSTAEAGSTSKDDASTGMSLMLVVVIVVLALVVGIVIILAAVFLRNKNRAGAGAANSVDGMHSFVNPVYASSPSFENDSSA